MVLACIVLLAACANLGSLFAARTSDRAREIAIRMAIGSSRWRVLRQILTEAFVVSILGGACACALAWLALSGLDTWNPPTSFPIHFYVSPNPSLILAAFLISIVAGVLFGIIPLRQIFKADPNEAIKGGSMQAVAGRRWALRDVLLAAQIALCCITVTSAFVAVRGLSKSITTEMGFKPENAVLTKFELSQAGYTADTYDHFQRQLLDRISALPSVEAAGYANSTPLSLDQSMENVFSQETTDIRPSNRAFDTYFYNVSPGFLQAAGIPLLAGRDLSFADTAKSPAVAIVNQEFARRLFHSVDAVGRFYKNTSGKPVQVVGVVPDGKYFYLSEKQEAAAFFPVEQKEQTGRTTLVVRSKDDANAVATAVRKLIRDLDPAVPLEESSSWTNQLAIQIFPAQTATIALSLFGAFGLLLSITGTFGLASYSVSKRLRELSIRVALGAQARQILSTALGRMFILLGTGSVIGIVLGLAASRLLSAVVYQASAQDPLVLAAVAFTILLTGSLSVAGPVRRALHIDPATLLREQ
jgi:predicted permease